MVKLIVLFACIATSYGHLCLLSPPQRGSISGLNKPGELQQPYNLSSLSILLEPYTPSLQKIIVVICRFYSPHHQYQKWSHYALCTLISPHSMRANTFCFFGQIPRDCFPVCFCTVQLLTIFISGFLSMFHEQVATVHNEDSCNTNSSLVQRHFSECFYAYFAASDDCILMKAPCGGRPARHSEGIAYKWVSHRF